MLQSICIEFPSTAGTTTEERYAAWPLKGDWQIEECYFAASTAITANATNYVVLTVSTNDGAGGAFTSIGSVNGASASVAVDTPAELTISGAGLNIVQGSLIKLAKTVGGTGGAVDGALTVVARKIP